MDKQYITTVCLNWRGLSFRYRLRLFLWAFTQTYRLRGLLKKEYAEWSILGVFRNRRQKIAYILDHYILWGFYCVVALIFGSAHGFQWSIPDRGCEIHGIRISPNL